MDASLAEQMDRLKKTMHSRDERRDKDREKRMVRFSGAIFESARFSLCIQVMVFSMRAAIHLVCSY